METSFHVEGGNTGLWLGLSTIPTDPGAFHRLQQQWAASMAIAQNTGSSIKTARVDAYYRCKKQRVASKGGFRLSPGTKLIPAYRQYILRVAKDQVHKIAEHFGIFFAKSANLGGVVQKTYTMQMTKQLLTTSKSDYYLHGARAPDGTRDLSSPGEGSGGGLSGLLPQERLQLHHRTTISY